MSTRGIALFVSVFAATPLLAAGDQDGLSPKVAEVRKVSPAKENATEVDIHSLIARMREKHPVLEQTKANIAASEAKISVANSAYWPTLELNAVYTTGFPAGIINLNGIPGAAFRSGPAAGVVLKQTLWDFDRTAFTVAAAKAETTLRRSEGEAQLLQAEEGVFRIYFECARLREQIRLWGGLYEEFALVHSQVSKFVQSGQRSSVEEVLARSQYEDALTRFQDSRLRYDLVRRRLEESAALPGPATCPELGDRTKIEVDFGASLEKSPLLQSLREEIKVAEAQKDQFRAQYNPKLFALASYGVMENRSAGSELYSVGVGLVVPIFTGFRKDRETGQAQAQVEVKIAKLRLGERQLRELSLRYEESIRSADLRTERLREELRITENAFEKAKRRYFLLRGQLVDFRETVRNLATTHSKLTDALMEAHLMRALYAAMLGDFASVAPAKGEEK